VRIQPHLTQATLTRQITNVCVFCYFFKKNIYLHLLYQVSTNSFSHGNVRPFYWGSIHTTLEEFENVTLFLRLGLRSTLIRHENGAFRKGSSNRRNRKTPALRFHLDRKHFENRAGVTTITWFPWPVIGAFLNSSGVTWTRGAWVPQRNVMHVITVLPREWKRATPCYLHC